MRIQKKLEIHLQKSWEKEDYNKEILNRQRGGN